MENINDSMKNGSRPSKNNPLWNPGADLNEKLEYLVKELPGVKKSYAKSG